MENIITELDKLSPQDSDVLILTMFVEDVDIVFVDDIQESSEQLSEVLSDHLGFNIPVITLPHDLSMLNREQCEILIKQLQDSLTNISCKDNIDLSNYE